jgi:holo-[acyl-carrier protein] synthase
VEVDLRGIGVDLVEVDRMRRTLARTPALVERLFTDDERAYCERRRDPTERFAARFAAKEAVMKALGVGLGAVGWHEVEVVRAESGRPSLALTGRAAELAAELGVVRWHLTMSHTSRVAEAVAVAE